MKFEKFNKIPRLSRDIIITEKIDIIADICEMLEEVKK